MERSARGPREEELGETPVERFSTAEEWESWLVVCGLLNQWGEEIFLAVIKRYEIWGSPFVSICQTRDSHGAEDFYWEIPKAT